MNLPSVARTRGASSARLAGAQESLRAQGARRRQTADRTFPEHHQQAMITNNKLCVEPAERDRGDSRGYVQRPGDRPREQVKQDG